MLSAESAEATADRIVAELEGLLSESPASAAERMDRQAQPFRAMSPLFALYGAGQVGRTVLAKLRACGVEPVAFADDTAEKQGQLIDGLPVLKPQDAAKRFGSQLVFVVTILNPKLNFLTAKRRLQQLTGAQTISFLHLAWIYPDTFLPYGQFETPQNVLTKAPDIKRGFDLMSDAQSRAQFVAHLRFRLLLDYEALPPCVPDNYFPDGVLPELPSNVVFIDCGAYDGDTLRAFLAHQANRFGQIYAFEPDPRNCDRLRSYVSSQGAKADRISIVNAGVGERRALLRFDSAGNMGSSFSAAGASEVEVVPIDEIVQADGAPIYLKFDVEGGEWEALKGCSRLLEQGRPLMALSVYHRPDDLWQLPIHIDSLGLDYQTFLRTQGEDGMDVIAYFVTRSA